MNVSSHSDLRRPCWESVLTHHRWPSPRWRMREIRKTCTNLKRNTSAFLLFKMKNSLAVENCPWRSSAHFPRFLAMALKDFYNVQGLKIFLSRDSTAWPKHVFLWHASSCLCATSLPHLPFVCVLWLLCGWHPPPHWCASRVNEQWDALALAGVLITVESKEFTDVWFKSPLQRSPTETRSSPAEHNATFCMAAQRHYKSACARQAWES